MVVLLDTFDLINVAYKAIFIENLNRPDAKTVALQGSLYAKNPQLFIKLTL